MNVGPNESVVEIKNPTTGETTKHEVAPGKDTTLPVPNVPGGTHLVVAVGQGINRRKSVVEVVAPGP